MSGIPKNSQETLNSIFQKLQGSKSLSELLSQIESDMLAYLNAERITIYQKGPGGREIVSRYHSEDSQVLEIRLPLAPSSIAGYVAMSHRSLRLDDVYDTPTLAAIHPHLQFDRRFDTQSSFRSRSMMVIPVKFGSILLGLLQVINRIGGGAFTEHDMSNAQNLARLISHKLRTECQSTRGPYDLLVQEGHITNQKLTELRNNAAGADDKLEDELLTMGISSQLIGQSLERYYLTPFFPFTPNWIPPAELWKNLNPATLKRQMWIPVAGNQNKAVITIDDPSDIKRIMDMQSTLKANSYEICVSLHADLLRFAQRASEFHKNEPTPEAVILTVPADHNEEDFAILLANRLVATALRANADELSIRVHPENHTGIAALHIGDNVRVISSLPQDQLEGVVRRMKTLAQLDSNQTNQIQQGMFTVKSGGKILDVSLATTPEYGGEGVFVKIIRR